MISVAMATYNGEKFIKKQLQSIIDQSVIPDEIVISDDCSEDKTLEIVDSFIKLHSNIKWIVKKGTKNQGYIKNFYNAINYTSGEIIILADQDDLWDKDKVKLFKEWFNNNTDILSIHTDYYIIDRNDNIIGNKQIGYKEKLSKYSLKKFCRRLNYCGMSSAFRNTIKNEILLIDPEKIPTHDWLIHAISVLNEGMYVSNIATSFRRYHGNNVALNVEKQKDRKGTSQRIEIVCEFQNYYQVMKNIIPENDKKEALFEYIEMLINLQKKRIEYLKTRNIFNWILNIRQIKLYPSIKSYFCDFIYICGIF